MNCSWTNTLHLHAVMTNWITFVNACFHALLFFGRDTVTILVVTTGMVVEFYTFLLYVHCFCTTLQLGVYCVPRWIDGLLAWIYIKLLITQ